jgi:hypothetical protein
LYDLNALAILEEEFDINLMDEGLEPEDYTTPKTLRALIYVGLIHEDEELTLDDVGHMVQLDILDELVEAFGKAFAKAAGTLDDDSGKVEANPESPGAGVL